MDTVSIMLFWFAFVYIMGGLILFPIGSNTDIKIQRSTVAVFLILIGIILLFITAIKVDIDNVSVDKTAQTKTLEKPEASGQLIDFADLPDGSYSQVKDEHFAFVKRESKDPFDQEIIAVRSSRKIPEHFAIKKIAEKPAP